MSENRRLMSICQLVYMKFTILNIQSELWQKFIDDNKKCVEEETLELECWLNIISTTLNWEIMTTQTPNLLILSICKGYFNHKYT